MGRARCIYIVENENNLLKIGRSINPDVRIRTIETQGGSKIINAFISDHTPCYHLVESYLHDFFKKNRTLGEWFDVDFNEVIKFFNQKKWETTEYFQAVKEEEISKNKHTEGPTAILRAFNEITLNQVSQQIKNKDKTHITHCDYCMIPIEDYTTFKTYPSEKCCEFYSEYDYIAQCFVDKYKTFSVNKFFQKCINVLSPQFPDVPNIKATIDECLDISLDIGIFDWYQPRILGEWPSPATKAKLAAKNPKSKLHKELEA